MSKVWEEIPLVVREMMVKEKRLQDRRIAYQVYTEEDFKNTSYQEGDSHKYDSGFSWTHSCLGKEGTTPNMYYDAWKQVLDIFNPTYILWEEIYGSIVSYTIVEQNGEKFIV